MRADGAGALEGLWRITGTDHDLLVELRRSRVVRFRNGEASGWNAPAPTMLLTSECTTDVGHRLRLSWTFRDITAAGRDAIRQEYSFTGTLEADGVAKGTITLRIVAEFLEPTVILADASEPAVLRRQNDREEVGVACGQCRGADQVADCAETNGLPTD